MRRRGFTLVELSIAAVISAITAGAVLGVLRAFADAMTSQDSMADGTARIARVEARMADHLERARLVLLQDNDEVLLWLPNEPFTSGATNTAEYDAINANELAWYWFDPVTRTMQLSIVSNRSDRTTYALATNWSALRPTLQVQGNLSSTTVLEGLDSGAFLVQSGDPCTVRRFTFAGQLDAAHGSISVQLGGHLTNFQRHPDCP
jgi:prepilin-type N-terminal cleavage/methylation domain-containing protein